MSCEPLITIWGKELSIAQSITIRVALESFRSDLIQNGLGNDEIGKKIAMEYLKRIEELRVLMFETVTPPSSTVTTLKE